MTADERRRAILEALSIRRSDTVDNLAFEFGVSVRTVKYDIERRIFGSVFVSYFCLVGKNEKTEENVSLIAINSTRKNYILEAESVDIKGLTAPGSSNTYIGSELIYDAKQSKISGYVSRGISLQTFIRRISAFNKTVKLSPDSFDITANGGKLNYALFDLSAGVA